MGRERWMALFFALGSTCFLIGPFPGYAQLVGSSADAVTFFIEGYSERPLPASLHLSRRRSEDR